MSLYFFTAFYRLYWTFLIQSLHDCLKSKSSCHIVFLIEPCLINYKLTKLNGQTVCTSVGASVAEVTSVRWLALTTSKCAPSLIASEKITFEPVIDFDSLSVPTGVSSMTWP